MSNAMALNEGNLPKGVVIATGSFAGMLALGFALAKCVEAGNVYVPYTPSAIVSAGMLTIACLALPMLGAGVRGKLKTTVALGAISSAILGAMICIAS